MGMTQERRRHVRTKPTPALPARAVRALDALVQESLEIVDISVGGMALASVNMEPGAKMTVTLSLAGHGDHVVDVVVRWAAQDSIGVELVDPPAAAAQAIQRYVAELLERGAAG